MDRTLKNHFNPPIWQINDTLRKLMEYAADGCECCMEPNDFAEVRKIITNLRKASREQMKEEYIRNPTQHVEYMMYVWKGEIAQLTRRKHFLNKRYNFQGFERIRTSAFILHQVWHGRCWVDHVEENKEN